MEISLLALKTYNLVLAIERELIQHKRFADFGTAALCAEGTWSVVNMLAILAGRRGRRVT